MPTLTVPNTSGSSKQVIQATPRKTTTGKLTASPSPSDSDKNTLEQMCFYIQSGQVKNVKFILKPYQNVPFWEAQIELLSGEKKSLELSSTDVERMKVFCRQYHVSYSSESFGVRGATLSFLRDSAIQLVIPLAFATMGWFGSRFYSGLTYRSKVNSSVINPENYVLSKDKFDLSETRNKIAGVHEIHRFAEAFEDQLKHFEQTGEMKSFGATIQGADGSGKTTVLNNALRMWLEKDPKSIAFELKEDMSAGNIAQRIFRTFTLKDKAKAYVQKALKEGKTTILLRADDPEQDGGSFNVSSILQLGKAINDEAERHGIKTIFLLSTNEDIESLSANKNAYEALTRRLGQVYSLESFSDQEIREQLEFFLKKYFSSADQAFVDAFMDIEGNGITKENKGEYLKPVFIDQLIYHLKQKGKSLSDLTSELQDPNSKLKQNIIAEIVGKTAKNP